MDYYNNSGLKWSSDEEEKVINEYNEQKLDINDIGKIHKRTPGGISARLAILGVIPDRRNVDIYQGINQGKIGIIL